MVAALEARHERLADWLRFQRPEVDGVVIKDSDALELGHSAEMAVLTLGWQHAGAEELQDVVLKLRPPSPGLLEPYDMDRQFQILRALEPTDVRAPRALWADPSGDVLGRDFYVMERSEGSVFEREVPQELDDDPERIPRMCDAMIDQLVAVHAVDLATTGLDRLGDPSTFIDRELERWAGEVRRVQRGPLPALERLRDELHRQRPDASPHTTLVHGDIKPGNFAFVDDEVSALFDWEMADIGDPMADIGYLELMWSYPVGITSRPTAPDIEDVLDRYQDCSGLELVHRPWYRAFQAYKTAAIMLVGSMLFESGHSSDMRYLEMSLGIDMTTQPALRDLGVDEELDAGPVIPSDARIEAVMSRAENHPGS